MIYIAVCDDNKDDLRGLRDALCQTKQSCSITEYKDAETLLEEVETGCRQFDLFFLDIYLPGLNGIEAAHRIRVVNEDAVLIFLTTSEEFYREAFDVYAFHYLLKPVKCGELKEVMEKAVARIDKTEIKLSITYHGQSMLLKQANIAYISSAGHYLHFHMKDGQEYTSYGKLDDAEEQLESDLFVRSHKSFMVNLLHIDKLAKEGFYIGNTLVPISRSYAASAKERCYRWLFGTLQNG